MTRPYDLAVDGIVFALQEAGGISVYFTELLSGLLGYNSSIYFQAFTNAWPKELLGPKLPVFDQRMRLLERYRRCQLATPALLFHSSYYRLPDCQNIDVITTVHDFTYERHSLGLRKWVHSWQKFQAIRASAAIICVSEHTKMDLLEFLPDVDEDRIRVIYHGASACFRPLVHFEDDVPDGPYALFVGGRKGYKNFDKAVLAVAQIPGVKLVFTGGGRLSGSEKEFLNTKLPERHQHMGNVPFDLLNKLYNGAACLIYPSSYEGFGIPIIEAMRAGCPVIAVCRSSIPEVAGDSAVLLDSADPMSIAAAVSNLLIPENRNRIRNLGLGRAKKFTWERTVAQTIEVYEEVLGRPIRHVRGAD